MKIYHIALPLLASCALSSCIKDEPANAECDIEAAWVHFNNPAECVWNLSDTMKLVPSNITDIVFEVRAGTDRTAIAPQFKITPGPPYRRPAARRWTSAPRLYYIR